MISIKDLDIIFLTYDEPKAEEFWYDLKKKCYWAKRVHGIKGFDAAHKKCAEIANTERFITVDGDNIIDERFLSLKLEIPKEKEDCVFSWAGKNHVNGLVYGNGGLKCWPKKFVQNMQSHENSTERDGVDFCWDDKYIQMEDSYSVTYTNGSPYQAYRAGFREGVKLSLDRGRKVSLFEIDNGKLWHGNIKRLAIWCTIGADVENGLWSIYGARNGLYLTNLTDFNCSLIADYDWFPKHWQQINETVKQKDDLIDAIKQLGKEIRNKMGFSIADLNADASRFFKHVYVAPSRTGYKL